ncbi:MAG: hypothetical protein H6711_15815 [Myxococcales bacterium]|nr:hypothetical protein [Myxococcales bacterium]
MPTTVLLRDDMGRPWRVTLSGRQVITGEGKSQVIQDLRSAEQAREHFEGVLKRRRREGYSLIEVREIDAADPLLHPDPLADQANWSPEAGTLVIVFRDVADQAFCKAVVARAVELQPRVLQLVCDPASPGEALADALLSATLPSLEALVFDTHFQTVTRQQRNLLGDLAEVFEAMPNLQRAFITGAVQLSPLVHRNLRELYLLGDPLADDTVAALGECKLPALERLAITLASDSGPIDARALLRGLATLKAPPLQALEVEGVASVVDFLRRLPPGLLADGAQLSVEGSIADEDELLAALREVRPNFARLGSVALPLADALSQGADEEARRLVPCLCDREEVESSLLPSTYLDW